MNKNSGNENFGLLSPSWRAAVGVLKSKDRRHSFPALAALLKLQPR
jgi:hypothetical protein